jgi:hypothetical protein
MVCASSLFLPNHVLSNDKTCRHTGSVFDPIVSCSRLNFKRIETMQCNEGRGLNLRRIVCRHQEKNSRSVFPFKMGYNDVGGS